MFIDYYLTFNFKSNNIVFKFIQPYWLVVVVDITFEYLNYP